MTDIATPPSSAPRRERQLKEVRFLETLQTTLAGCSTETAIYSAAVHRVAAAFGAAAVCLAAYDPIAGTLELLHQARTKHRWDMDLLGQAASEERLISAGAMVAVPVICADGAYRGSEATRRVWGVLAVARATGAATEAAPGFTADERHTLRAAADHLGAELERRRGALLDDVLDGLLRKAKPIDVYTHTLRELRRFIRYDHSASVMTMQRGMAQLTVRVEKVVSARGRTETLVDSPRRGRTIRLTMAQTRYLRRLKDAVELTNDGAGWHITSGPRDPDAAGLWRVLCLTLDSGEGSILCYPLIFGSQMLGILRLATRRPGALQPLAPYARLLDRFARLLSVTLYRSELYHQSDRQLQAIKESSRVITQPMPVREICQQVLHLALRVLHVQVGAVGLLSGAGKLELAAHHGSTLAEPPVLTLGEGISGVVVQTGRSRAVPDVTKEPAYVAFNGRVCSELVVPITYDCEVIGFLDVESFEEGRFREEDEEVITFLEALANQAAIAIKAAQLRSEAVEHLGTSMAIDPSLTMAGLQDLLIMELRDKIAQLAGANERLEAANRAKSQFLAHMSHDLRGPLNVIVGLSSLLTDPQVTATLDEERRRQSLELIRANGELLGSLIGNILDLSAVEAGKVQLNLAPLDAATAFEYLRAVATTLAGESHKELQIDVALDPSIGQITVDEEKFLRIMYNLVSNAVKFTPSGGRITVTATAMTEPAMSDPAVPPSTGAAPGRGLHVTVADSGIGIAPEQQERVFEAFQQINGTASQYHGTGLGLTVVRQLVELHGGRVWLESASGAGSTFHVVLPTALPGDEVAAATSADEVEAFEEYLHDASVLPTALASRKAPLSVLVVEDIPAQMSMIRLAVTSRGYTMHGASSAAEALDWLNEHRPDVILLDMQLPDRDGFSVAERIKGRIETASIPLVAVTADVLSGTEERARAAGCDAYLTKPIDIAALLDTIERVASSQ